MVTIKEVARRAGVSIATVSRVINNVDNVGEKYKEAVLKAIDEMNYHPNIAARSLRNRYYKVIGVIIPDFSIPFFEKIIKNIESNFYKEGHIVLFVNTYNNPKIEKESFCFMLEKQADIILICSTGGNEDYLKRYNKRDDLQIILLDRRIKCHKYPIVCLNKRKGMYLAVDYLAKKGHKKIALISGPRRISTNYDRYMGIKDYLYDHEQTWNGHILYYFGQFSEQYGYSTMKKILHNKNHSTAIITGGSMIAKGVFLYCRENNLRIPEDISLISFGDFSSGELICPRITYIGDEYKKIGSSLIKLIRLAFTRRLNNIEIVIQPQLYLHDSVMEIKEK